MIAIPRVIYVAGLASMLLANISAAGSDRESDVENTNAELIDLAWSFLRSEEPFNWEAQEQSSDIMDRRQIAAAVLMADERVVEGLFQILETTPLDGPDAPRVNLHSPLRKLGVIASVDPERVDAKRLIRVVERIEQSTMPINRFLELTGDGYLTLGRTGDQEALEFVLRRTSKHFWEVNEYPHRETIRDLLGTEARITIRGAPVGAVNPKGDPKGGAILNALLEQFEAEGDKEGAMAVRVELGLSEWKARYHQALLDSIKRVRAERGLAGGSGIVEVSDASSSQDTHDDNGITAEKPASKTAQAATNNRMWPWILLATICIAMTAGYAIIRQRNRGPRDEMSGLRG